MLAMPVIVVPMPFVLECSELPQLGVGHRLVVRHRHSRWCRMDAHSGKERSRWELRLCKDSLRPKKCFRQAYIDPPSSFGLVEFVSISTNAAGTTRRASTEQALPRSRPGALFFCLKLPRGVTARHLHNSSFLGLRKYHLQHIT